MPELAEVHADVKLVERTLSGDLDSFGELHRRYYHRVVHVVFGVVRDRILAEDMVQDAYIAALKERKPGVTLLSGEVDVRLPLRAVEACEALWARLNR